MTKTTVADTAAIFKIKAFCAAHNFINAAQALTRAVDLMVSTWPTFMTPAFAAESLTKQLDELLKYSNDVELVYIPGLHTWESPATFEHFEIDLNQHRTFRIHTYKTTHGLDLAFTDL